MTLAEHLRELRRRLVIAALAIVLGTAIAFIFHTHIQHIVTQPYCGLPAKYRLIHDRCTLVVSGVLDPFTVTLRLSLYAGLLLSCPVWLWQLWRFVTPGLYQNERRWALAFVSSSSVLFAAGAVVAYVTMPNGLRFLLSFATSGIASLLTFTSYLSYFTAMVLVFAVSFEFPLAIVMLNVVGVVSAARLRRWARGIIFGLFAFAAVATPSQDPFTMLALALPMCLLFGAALGVATLHDRRVAQRGESSLYADLGDDELSRLDDEPLDDDRVSP
ncbi:MAG TPA: twin-arginine translocase subunit TatC [Mycobacteriales bacterium]|nr:twin-arginine translocase subunit TatC [Mycobacteriales bacterium]